MTITDVKEWITKAPDDKVSVILWVDGRERKFELTGLCGEYLEHGVQLVIQATDETVSS